MGITVSMTVRIYSGTEPSRSVLSEEVLVELDELAEAVTSGTGLPKTRAEKKRAVTALYCMLAG